MCSITKGRSSRLLAIIVVVVVAAMAVPAAAFGHSTMVATQHSLSLAAGALSGQLYSDTSECLGGRSITVHRASGADDMLVATVSTTASGVWSHPIGGLPGAAYYAHAARQVRNQRGDKHVCEAARSNTVNVPPDSDGDGVRDPSDNCPDVANPGQQDSDGDGLGDACNPDADGDGYTVGDGDCADNDAYRHPGAADDKPNGIDDDCDGTVDEDVAATGIVYSDTYWRYMAAFPAGYADWCAIYFLNGGEGGCTTIVQIKYFYPDGTYGDRPWVVDPSSPNGWSIEPNPCDVLTEQDYQEWLAYLEADTSMSDLELQAGLTYPFDLYVSCYVPFEGF